MLRQLQSFASVVIVIAACFYSCSPKDSDSGKAIAENILSVLPMARSNEGANWLSTTEELVNPYMGQIMLECGRTQEKLE